MSEVKRREAPHTSGQYDVCRITTILDEREQLILRQQVVRLERFCLRNETLEKGA